MTFNWSNLGLAPAADEVEVSFFGPGFGECIVAHVGGGSWLVVDSCIDASDKIDRRSVAEKYLNGIGVDLPAQVKAVVATHWHDDHVRGLSGLLERAASAKFTCANVFARDDFVHFVEAIASGGPLAEGGKVSEIRKVICLLRATKRTIRYATAGKAIGSWGGDDPTGFCNLTSLSPSDADLDRFLLEIAKRTPSAKDTIRAASTLTPNLVSVVLHLQVPKFSILLCADMEVVADSSRGWRAVFQEATDRRLSAASLVKVAHHGSANGHLDDAWEKMILKDPVAVVTPYNCLPDDKKLPTAGDLDRIKERAKHLYLTGPKSSRAQRKIGDRSVARSLSESGIRVRSLGAPMGMVRLRRKFDEPEWRSEVFAPAEDLSN